MCIRDRILTVFFCFTAAVGIGPTGTGAAKHINTGLDLAGGVSITYQAKESNPTSEEMSDTIYKLQKRVEQYSTEEMCIRDSQKSLFLQKTSRKNLILFLSLEMVIRRWRKKQQNCLRKGWRTGFCPVENTA